MLGMVEIGNHQFLIEGRVKALPFLTGFTQHFMTLFLIFPVIPQKLWSTEVCLNL